MVEEGHVGLEGRTKVFVVIGLMLAMSVAALDGTVVSTAMPTIVGKLGGLSLFSWVFSIYLLTSTVPVPLYGKLADLYGRKPVLLFGCGMFMAGSALCGAAGSMEQLIIFRAVQGLGAGAIMPIVITIIGDNFMIEERARIQGFFSGVWGFASLLGPVVGGLITQGVSWRWIFLINLPIGALGILILWYFFHENLTRRRHVIDFYGMSLLSGSLVAFLLALLDGVTNWGWFGGPTLALFFVAAVLLGIFLWQEQRVEEPLILLSLFKNKVIAIVSLSMLMAGAMMFGFQSYVPLFVQGVRGGSALDAGLVLLPMSFLWTVGSVVSGFLLVRYGYYLSLVVGGVLLVVGAATLLFLGRDTTMMVAVISGAFCGIGMGFCMPALMISVQNAVEWHQRGVATALAQFFRTIGGSVSVAIMGAMLTSRMSGRLDGVNGVPEGFKADSLLNNAERTNLSASVLDAAESVLATSLHEVYFLILACAAITLAVVLFFPRGKAQELMVGAEKPVEGSREAIQPEPGIGLIGGG
ncbi:MAG TPA: MDR family MFS transporter [Dehalococcoidia bacterium]|nr:MDR family MFS transporter [Dehalococcoidia bacterium]